MLLVVGVGSWSRLRSAVDPTLVDLPPPLPEVDRSFIDGALSVPVSFGA